MITSITIDLRLNKQYLNKSESVGHVLGEKSVQDLLLLLGEESENMMKRFFLVNILNADLARKNIADLLTERYGDQWSVRNISKKKRVYRVLDLYIHEEDK